jgi:histone chaperone ASF1
MTAVNLTNVTVLDNPSPFTNPFQFEVTFECLQELQDDLEWKVTYVGCAESEEHDQVLEEVLVGPVPMGVNKFVLQASPADHTKIPPDDLLGVTVVLLTCSYRDKEFVRVGYYVSNSSLDAKEEINPETNQLESVVPVVTDIRRVQRHLLADKPRVTRFPIDWDEPSENEAQNQMSNEGDLQEAQMKTDVDMMETEAVPMQQETY